MKKQSRKLEQRLTVNNTMFGFNKKAYCYAITCKTLKHCEIKTTIRRPKKKTESLDITSP